MDHKLLIAFDSYIALVRSSALLSPINYTLFAEGLLDVSKSLSWILSNLCVT